MPHPVWNSQVKRVKDNFGKISKHDKSNYSCSLGFKDAIPPIDLYLDFRIPILSIQVQRFFVYFVLDFRRLHMQ